MGQDTAQIRREIDATRARMGDTVEAIGYKADVPARVRDNVNDRIDSVKGTITDAVAGARKAVRGTTQRASDSASDSLAGANDALADAGDRAQRAVASTKANVSVALENPLGLALGGLAVGLLAGLVIPISDIEREKIGPVRDQIADRAQTAVSQAVDAGKTILTDAVATGAHSAQTQGADIARNAVSGTPLEQQSPETDTGSDEA